MAIPFYDNIDLNNNKIINLKAPENDAMALTQLRTIRHLRGILKSEMKSGVPINPTLINFHCIYRQIC